MREAPALPRGPAAPGAPGPGPVPGFLAKLWALLEDPDSDDVICWSRNGENFCILDEQRFAKELLPKYFKHNNISSFIRQLNMCKHQRFLHTLSAKFIAIWLWSGFLKQANELGKSFILKNLSPDLRNGFVDFLSTDGFRKVIALENGIITAEKSSVIEFQHPFFKQGKAHLLENIKRKVSAVRTEDLKVCTEDLHKVLSEVQEMREQQNNMDVRLANMKRENKALWKEVAVLRQKHSQQQKLLSKILQFILSLMRGNYIVGVKRKRSLTDAAGASPSKYSRQYVRIPVESGQAMAFSEHSAAEEDGNGTGLIIRDITDTLENATNGLLAVAHTSGRAREPQAALDPGLPLCQVSQPSELSCAEPVPSVAVNDVTKSSEIGTAAVELHTAQPNAPEDPVSVIDSILNENNPGNQNDPLLDREEIQDFLNCIDASLEELQTMLSGKQYNFGAEAFSDTFNPELPALDMNLMETPAGIENMANLAESTEGLGASERETAGSKDMQLIQYRANPLLSLFEELPSGEAAGKADDPKDFLLPALEEKPALQPPSASGAVVPLAAPAAQAEPLDTLGMGDPPLLPEDGNGEYKLFPLLLLSPVANFIDEASEIEIS
ncbi:Heat shock factor protein 3 [Lonchura striata]|uniref:Heat shock factor protein 3 n=1 Tax=Lonchura striata TaxID=40157 RepID=A0A218V3J2_9PASE|nr:Heat shock factor protein 3 [Lonchura striata domestica]